MHGIAVIRCCAAATLLVVMLTAATADADLLYENYTPGTTDYNAGEKRLISSPRPVYSFVGGFETPGKNRELRFNFTPTRSIVPRYAYVPLYADYVNWSEHIVRVEIRDPLSNQYWWSAGYVEDFIDDDQTAEALIYFSQNEAVPPVQAGKEYQIVVTTIDSFSDLLDAYLSNVANASATYYTADTSVFDPMVSNETFTPLPYEPAVSIHGDLVPEPASVALFGLGGLAVLRRSRR